jgi:hypothetical protein
MAGLANSFVSALGVAAFYPGKRGRVTKRLVVLFSFPSLIQAIEAVQMISSKIGVQAANNKPIDGFYVAEVILASLILLLAAVILYPASEAVAPFEYQTNAPLRAVSISVNTVVGAIVLIYFCFSIYGVHAAFDPPWRVPNVPPPKLSVSTFGLPITSLLLLSILGAFVAIGRGVRPHIVPSLVIGIVCLSMFLELTQPYVQWLNGNATAQHTGDWRDYAYVGMFVLNCLSMVGLAVQVSLAAAFLYY